MTRIHAGAFVLAAALMLAIMLSGCAPNRPPFCPPPFGCEK